MFTKKRSFRFRELTVGVTMCPLAYGERTNLCEFRLSEGHRVPSHSHPFEQTGWLATGRLHFRIGFMLKQATVGAFL